MYLKQLLKICIYFRRDQPTILPIQQGETSPDGVRGWFGPGGTFVLCWAEIVLSSAAAELSWERDAVGMHRSPTELVVPVLSWLGAVTTVMIPALLQCLH